MFAILTSTVSDVAHLAAHAVLAVFNASYEGHDCPGRLYTHTENGHEQFAHGGRR